MIFKLNIGLISPLTVGEVESSPSCDTQTAWVDNLVMKRTRLESNNRRYMCHVGDNRL